MHKKRFIVFDPAHETATTVAGGVVNPVVLKRFTPVWNVHQFLPKAFPFYNSISERLETSFVEHASLQRIFNSVEEQNNWMVASDSHRLSPFLSSEIIANDNPSVEAPFGFGSVQEVFRINTPALSTAYRNELLEQGALVSETFDHSSLQDSGDYFQYRNYRAQKIVFAEGSKVVNNPYFKINSLIPKKGEYIWVKAPQLRLKSILKGGLFVIPQGNDHYKIGATFDHHGTEANVTEHGRQELDEGLRKIVNCPFEVVDQVAGMRPTVKDRRPLLGSLEHERIYFFNGLGTRGLLMAPLMSKLLYKFAENNKPLANEINIKRYFSRD